MRSFPSEMSDERAAPRTRYRNRGCGFGCASFFFVLTVGVVLSLFNIALSIGLSVRVPLTESNFTVAGSIGEKGKAVAVLPDYAEGRVGGNQNLFNNSITTTIWRAEGITLVILGKQDGAPAIDLHLELR
jgi:hypothetical protein